MAGINELKQKIESDVAFREALEKAADGNELLSKIKESGFDVTLEEIENTVSSENGELSDDELEGAAGGGQVIRPDDKYRMYVCQNKNCRNSGVYYIGTGINEYPVPQARTCERCGGIMKLYQRLSLRMK